MKPSLALFGNSTVTGLYPFTTYVMPFTADSPKPHTYAAAVYLENEYLRLDLYPRVRGRIFSLCTTSCVTARCFIATT